MISQAEQVIYRSPAPNDLYCYSPWITQGFGGRILLSYDIAGPGLRQIPGPKSDHGDYGSNQCQIQVSDDHGKTWRLTGRLPMLHARILRAGARLYLLGHSGRLLISRSDDNGESWSEPSVLDAVNRWHQAPCAVDHHGGRLYLSMEHMPFTDRWAGGDPLLMRADESADLCDPASWTFSNKLTFEATVPRTPNLFGIQPSCWLESNVVRVHDPNHKFHDPEGRSLLLFLRLGGMQSRNVAAVLRGREQGDGTLVLETVPQPDGTPLLFVPFPGGYMKFHILYDAHGARYWLIASESRTAMAKPETLTNDQRYFEDRQRLTLFHSKNLFDWRWAGCVAEGPAPSASRHYASMLIDGEDLLVLSRSGDTVAKNSHDTNLITLHRVCKFRTLAE